MCVCLICVLSAEFMYNTDMIFTYVTLILQETFGDGTEFTSATIKLIYCHLNVPKFAADINSIKPPHSYNITVHYKFNFFLKFFLWC